jgi:inner membrane protein
MMASTHVTFGLTCWTVYAQLRGIPFQPEALMVAGIASLLPDIDHPRSFFGSKVPFLSYPISAVFGHRGITHSLMAIVACVLVLLFYGGYSWILAPLIIGYLSHLGGDLITNSGVPLFWPNRDKIAFPVFNTGSFTEFFVRAGMTIFLIWMLWMQYKNSLSDVGVFH